jgi:hypothetical protein
MDLFQDEAQLARRSEQLLLGSKVLYWRDRRATAWAFFCPLCRSPRRLPMKPRPGRMHAVQIGLTAACFMLATWSLFSWKGIVSFVPMWAAFEAIYRVRLRAKLVCGSCGFDPYLYQVDVQRARAAVEAFWRRRFQERGIPYPEKAPGPASAPSARPIPPSPPAS